MFSPYRKLAKLSLNLDRLSCMICMSPMSASSVAIASESSAKAGSRTFSGKGSSAEDLPCWEPRDDRRRGVAGRELGRELEDFTGLPVEMENWTGVVEREAIFFLGGGVCVWVWVGVGGGGLFTCGDPPTGLPSHWRTPAQNLGMRKPRASGPFLAGGRRLTTTTTTQSKQTHRCASPAPPRIPPILPLIHPQSTPINPHPTPIYPSNLLQSVHSYRKERKKEKKSVAEYEHITQPSLNKQFL